MEKIELARELRRRKVEHKTIARGADPFGDTYLSFDELEPQFQEPYIQVAEDCLAILADRNVHTAAKVMTMKDPAREMDSSEPADSPGILIKCDTKRAPVIVTDIKTEVKPIKLQEFNPN